VKSWDLVEKGVALCNQCHDPFGKKTVVHDPVKEGDCAVCHNKPHGANARYLIDNSGNLFPLCTGCHNMQMFTKKFMHGPTAVGECTGCHTPHESAHKYLLKDTGSALCLRCHEDMAAGLKSLPVVHPPVKDSCTSCHDPHGTDVKGILKSPMPDLCMKCHDELVKKAAAVKVPHKPLQTGGCIGCHSPHFSKSKALLQDSEKEVCLSCHGTDNLGTPALKNIKREIAGKKYLHGPIEKGECTGCHSPHGSNNFRMLVGNYPATLYAPYTDTTYGACLKCHEKNMLRFPESSIYTKFRNGTRNLHYVHVSKIPKGRTCRFCHEPHASDGVKLISNESIAFGDWKVPINFKINPTGGSCAPGCHREFRYDRVQPQVY
jgi:predicted CXXCH cytochrome family protein